MIWLDRYYALKYQTDLQTTMYHKNIEFKFNYNMYIVHVPY